MIKSTVITIDDIDWSKISELGFSKAEKLRIDAFIEKTRNIIHPKVIAVMEAIVNLNQAIENCEKDLDAGFVLVEWNCGGDEPKHRSSVKHLKLQITAVQSDPGVWKSMEKDKLLAEQCDRKSAVVATQQKRAKVL